MYLILSVDDIFYVFFLDVFFYVMHVCMSFISLDMHPVNHTANRINWCPHHTILLKLKFDWTATNIVDLDCDSK